MYRVITVEEFLKIIYRDKYDRIAPFISRRILSGLINCSQFVQLSRKFPFSKAFGTNSAKIRNKSLPDASRILNKHCNIIDKALLRSGILRQVGYIMSANYYGFDMIIPVILKFASGRGRRRMRTVYTFIAIQSKAGAANVTEVIMKIEAGIHYVRCPQEHVQGCQSRCRTETSNEDMEEIMKNQLTLVISSSKQLIKDILVTEPTAPIPEDGDEGEGLNFNFFSFSGQEGINVVRSTFPEFQQTAIEEAQFKSVKSITPPALNHVPALSASFLIDRDISIGRMIWKNGRIILGQQTCIWMSSLNVFQSLAGRDVLDLADTIINYDHELISRSDEHQIPSLVDALVNTTFASYPDCDHSLRLDRGFEPLPNTLTNFNHLSTEVVAETSRIYSRKNPQGRPLLIIEFFKFIARF